MRQSSTCVSVEQTLVIIIIFSGFNLRILLLYALVGTVTAYSKLLSLATGFISWRGSTRVPVETPTCPFKVALQTFFNQRINHSVLSNFFKLCRYSSFLS